MNSRRKLNSLITLAALACLLAGCRKAKNTPINQEMLKYLAYNAGSYWVYEDSATGRIDSFYVLTTNASRVPYQGDDYNTIDQVTSVIIWYNLTADTVVERINWILKDNHVEWQSWRFTYGVFIFWPIVVGNSREYGNARITVLGSEPLYVPNKGQVLCTRLHHALTSGARPMDEEFYYNQDIGLVKMLFRRNYTNGDFKLIRYKLTK
jgi:hypothetical protein